MTRIGRRGTGVLAALVFVALLAIYASTLSPLPTWDAYANVFPAFSLLNDGDLAITPSEIPFLFTWVLPATGRRLQVPIWDRMIIEGSPAEDLYRAGKLRVEKEAYYFIVRTPGGEYVGTEPPGTAVAAAPFFWVMTLPDTARTLRNVVPLVQKSKLIAAIFTAAAAALVFATSARFLGPCAALLVALVFGLGSCAWSLASQALWAQTGMQPFVALGIDQFVRVRDRRGHALVAGVALGCAVACRSTSVFLLGAIALYLLVKDRRALALCVAGALPPLLLLAAYNFRYFGSPFTEAHALMGPGIAIAKTGSPDLWQTPLWLGAAGLLFSPARGLFVFSPVLALSFWGAYRVLRGRADAVFLPLVAAAALTMVLRFKWFDWWGGYSYGYRPLMDAIVPLALLLVPALQAWRPRALGRVVFALALAWSIGVQWIGTAYDSLGWDEYGVADHRVSRSIDDPRYRGRLWSIRDNPIAYYLVHRSEALASRDANLGELMRLPVEVRRVRP